MNKKKSSKLSSYEQEMLSLIGTRFDLAEQLVGIEPAIYLEFEVEPSVEMTETVAYLKRRQQLFNETVPVRPKEV